MLSARMPPATPWAAVSGPRTDPDVQNLNWEDHMETRPDHLFLNPGKFVVRDLIVNERNVVLLQTQRFPTR